MGQRPGLLWSKATKPFWLDVLLVVQAQFFQPVAQAAKTDAE